MKYERDPPPTSALKGTLFSVAMSAANLPKNRYKDILPYDATRVILSNPDGILGGDFINANQMPVRSSGLSCVVVVFIRDSATCWQRPLYVHGRCSSVVHY